MQKQIYFGIFTCCVQNKYKILIMLSEQPSEQHPIERQIDNSNESNCKNALNRTPNTRNTKVNKPIRKLRKNRKNSCDQMTRSESILETSRIKLDNTHEEKYEILYHYFNNEINDFCRQSFTFDHVQKLDALVKNNLLDMQSIYTRNIDQIWGSHPATDHELLSYLTLIKNITHARNQFEILYDQTNDQYYCRLVTGGQILLIRISQVEKVLLEKRHNFIKIYEESEKNFASNQNAKGVLMSQISKEMAFMYQNLYQSTKNLRNSVKNIIFSIDQMNQQAEKNFPSIYQESQFLQNESYRIKVKKLIKKALEDQQIDYLNFYKDQQIEEHNLVSAKGSIKDLKQLEQFLKKRKSSKLNKTSRSILHTGCEGCMSSFFESSNPFIFCQECGVRFHQTCFEGVYFTGKTVICTACSIKICKNDKKKRIKKKQCNFCGTKGLLFTSLPDNRQIHIFCMLINGLWEMKNKRAIFSYIQSQEDIEKNKCICCGETNQFTKKCIDCDNHAHPTCAYLNGWKMEAQFNDEENAPMLTIKCCENNNEEREQKRKFTIYFRKESIKKFF